MTLYERESFNGRSLTIEKRFFYDNISGAVMNKNHYVAIMAGGIGSRFWPMSRTALPKQFLDILNTG